MSPLNGTFKQNILKGTKADITIMNDPFASFVKLLRKAIELCSKVFSLFKIASPSQTGHVLQKILDILFSGGGGAVQFELREVGMAKQLLEKFGC